MVTDFYAAPVAADQPQPLASRVLIGQRTAKVIVRFGAGLPGLFDRPVIAQYDEAARKREIGGQRFDGERVEVAGIDSPVSNFGVDKKGVSGNRSKARPCLNRRGWLALICNR